MTGPTSPAAPMIEVPRERPPCAGFLYRAGATLIDGLVLYFVAVALERVGRNALLTLNPALPWLGHLAGFLYLWLADGPVGRGRTVGKAFFNLRVVGIDGRPLGAAPAFKRAILKQFVFFLFLNPDNYLLALPIAWHMAFARVFIVLSVISLTWIIALAFGLAMHPYKRGLHDLLAGSYVTWDPAPNAFRQLAAGEPNVVIQRRLALSSRLTLFFWVVATVAIMIKPLQTIMDPRVTAEAGLLGEMQTERPIAPFMTVALRMPEASDAVNFQAALREERRLAGMDPSVQAKDAPTTASLVASLVARGYPNGRTILTTAALRHGPFDASLIADKDFLARVEALRARLFDEARRRHAAAPAQYPVPERVTMLLFEPFQILFDNKPLPEVRIDGPADPATGPLTCQAVTSDPATGAIVPSAAGDAATTGTQHGASTPTPSR